MIRSYYKDKRQRIKTELSGGREHYPTRPRYIFRFDNDYTCQFGDVLYSVAEKYFGNENRWDILLDANEPIQPFDLYPEKIINVPEVCIEIETTNVFVL